MDTTKLLIGTVVGTIVNFFAGWLIYGMVVVKMMENGMTEAGKAASHEPDIMMIGLGCLATGFLIAYIYERWAGIRTWMTGATAGALLGALLSLIMNFNIGSMFHLFDGYSSMLIDMVANAVLCALTGAAVGWALGYNRK